MTLDQRLFYAYGRSGALDHAVQELQHQGISFTDTPSKQVTHLLLPTPCKQDVHEPMEQLSLDVTVIGGMLKQPELAGYRKIDLLTDPLYLAQNARITAWCALRMAAQQLPMTPEDCPALIIGWGRIGKCLASLMKNCGFDVSIAARNEQDRAMIAVLGYHAVDLAASDGQLNRYPLIFNTAPATVLSKQQCSSCKSDCLMIDLASSPGIADPRAIPARGLPARFAPISSGKLIARSVLRLCGQKEVQP